MNLLSNVSKVLIFVGLFFLTFNIHAIRPLDTMHPDSWNYSKLNCKSIVNNINFIRYQENSKDRVNGSSEKLDRISLRLVLENTFNKQPKIMNTYKASKSCFSDYKQKNDKILKQPRSSASLYQIDSFEQVVKPIKESVDFLSKAKSNLKKACQVEFYLDGQLCLQEIPKALLL